MENNYYSLKEIAEDFVFQTYKNEIPDGYSFDGYFRDSDDQHFTVSMSKDLEPEEVIKWCRNLYEKLSCVYVTKFE